MKFLRALPGLVIILALAIFLLSNRDAVIVSFWPFMALGSLPLGAIVVAALLLGFLCGLLFHLPHRWAATRRVKRAQKRNIELEAKLAAPPPTK